MPESNQLGEGVGVFIEDKMLQDEVSIYLSDSKQKGKDTDWPTIGEPCSLDAGNGMAEIVVVINNMIIVEMPFEWFGVLKGGGSLSVSISPDTSDFLPTHNAERSSCSHDLHHVVWLFHAPNGVFYVVEDARDGVNQANNL